MTEEQFTKIFGYSNKDIVDAMNKTMASFDISTKQRKAFFIAQIAHESGNFKSKSENLNYSESGLLTVFGKYFNNTSAKQYARKPKEIANRVYANRMGNGNEASGDGYRFRGRGFIQLTGKDNYLQIQKALKMTTIEEVLSYMETVQGAMWSAGWFWDTHKLNSYADKNDFDGCTRKINGGLNGIDHRKKILAKIMGEIS